MQIQIQIGLLSFKHISLDVEADTWPLLEHIHYIHLLTFTAFHTLLILYTICSFLFKLYHKIKYSCLQCYLSLLLQTLLSIFHVTLLFAFHCTWAIQ
jgi:hypothetical protein